MYKDVELKDMVEPIVDKKVFDQVQERLEESKVDRQVNRVIKPTLSLLGITKCGLCGSSLTSQSAKSGKHIYYKCSKKIHGGSFKLPFERSTSRCFRKLYLRFNGIDSDPRMNFLKRSIIK